MFDRVLAGWDAIVLVHNPADALPLRILGANVLALGSPTNDVRPDAITLAGALVETDDRIQCGVLEALDRGLAEVMLWGGDCPSELNRRIGSVQHRLSVAARAFKAEALTAASVPAVSIDPIETFHRGTSSARRWAAADLIPF